MKLNEVLTGCGAEPVSGGRVSAVDVTGVAQDSRKVKPGDIFFAVPGTKTDGANYVGEAIARGAVAVVGEKLEPAAVPTFTVTAPRQALALAAANFYRRPAQELTLLGVTGT